MIHVSFYRKPLLDGMPRKALINQCTNHGAWYQDLVGKIVLIELIDSEGYWGREGGEYNCINVIRVEDATLLPLEN